MLKILVFLQECCLYIHSPCTSASPPKIWSSIYSLPTHTVLLIIEHISTHYIELHKMIFVVIYSSYLTWPDKIPFPKMDKVHKSMVE